jgi:hypothetical protein
MQLFDGLDFDEEPLVDQYVDPERRLEAKAIELDIDRILTRDRIAHSGKLPGQHGLID